MCAVGACGPCGSWGLGPLLGGSWVVISGVISRVTLVISPIRGLVTPLISTREPPSKVWEPRRKLNH